MATPKIEKEMWCSNCDGTFITEDYFNCDKCPNCDIQPVSLCRTDSMTFVYAYLSKHPPTEIEEE
jgi:Zn finger protein HypA/HybF involved in hydrogenase expression